MLNQPRETLQVYSDDATLRCFGRLAALHALLAPYRADLMKNATRFGHPLVRPLWMHYPGDPTSLTIGAQVLLGRDLMVVPALSPGQTTVTAHLPPGRFVDVWTGTEHGSADAATSVTLTTAAGIPNLLATPGSSVATTLLRGVKALPENSC